MRAGGIGAIRNASSINGYCISFAIDFAAIGCPLDIQRVLGIEVDGRNTGRYRLTCKYFSRRNRAGCGNRQFLTNAAKEHEAAPEAHAINGAGAAKSKLLVAAHIISLEDADAQISGCAEVNSTTAGETKGVLILGIIRSNSAPAGEEAHIWLKMPHGEPYHRPYARFISVI